MYFFHFIYIYNYEITKEPLKIVFIWLLGVSNWSFARPTLKWSIAGLLGLKRTIKAYLTICFSFSNPGTTSLNQNQNCQFWFSRNRNCNQTAQAGSSSAWNWRNIGLVWFEPNCVRYNSKSITILLFSYPSLQKKKRTYYYLLRSLIFFTW